MLFKNMKLNTEKKVNKQTKKLIRFKLAWLGKTGITVGSGMTMAAILGFYFIFKRYVT